MTQIPQLSVNPHFAQPWLSYFTRTYLTFARASTLQLSLIVLSTLLIATTYFFLKSNLPRWTLRRHAHRPFFSQQIFFIFCRLLDQHLFLFLATLLLALINSLLAQALAPWLYLLFVWLIFRILLQLARFLLIDSMVDLSGRDVLIFRSLRVALIVLSLFSAALVLAHQLNAPIRLFALFNHGAMVLLGALSLVLLRYPKTLPLFLNDIFSIRRPYIRQAVYFLCFIAPATLLISSCIGLVGHLALAKTLAGYQLTCVLSLTIYMVCRGILIDCMQLLHRATILKFKHGWVVSQAFLKPLDFILRLCLFFSMLTTLTLFLHLNESPRSESLFAHLLLTPWFSFVGNPMSLFLLIKIGALLLLLIWLARWTRELTFRWLYRGARDIGLRNTLAIFTQYIVVITATLTSLNVLGISLSGLVWIAAALTAGIGFGLRDIVSNFFSGMVLLVERPFRNGDTIRIGEHEGEVLHTGVRALTLRTWDNMDVTIPNMDMFSKPCINWTHQNSIVRTIIPIKIHRKDDPSHVRALLLGILEAADCIANDPAPEVLMKSLEDNLITLEVRYFTDLALHPSRPRTRSVILFKIWEEFKTHGIKDPIVQYQVNHDQSLGQ